MFDLKQLRCFVAVADEMHFARAANGMNMTQSPLRRQIRLLEKDLGVHLLDRGARNVRLTRPGHAFLSDARVILQATSIGTLMTRQAATGERGAVTLGFTTAAAYALMPQIVAACRTQLPQVTLSLQEMSVVKQLRSVTAGELDFALVWAGTTPDLSSMLLGRDQLVAALPAHDARAAKPALSPADFDGSAFIMYDREGAPYLYSKVSRLLEGVAPQMTQCAANAHVLLSMVGSGMGAAIVPQSAAGMNQTGVIFRPLACDAQVETRGVWRSDNANPALARFLEVIASLGSTAPAVEQRQVDAPVAITRRKMDVVGFVK